MYIKNGTFLTKILKNLGEQRFMNNFYNLFIFNTQHVLDVNEIDVPLS